MPEIRRAGSAWLPQMQLDQSSRNSYSMCPLLFISPVFVLKNFDLDFLSKEKRLLAKYAVALNCEVMLFKLLFYEAEEEVPKFCHQDTARP